MIQQTIAHTHEIFSRDDTVEVLPRIYKGDVGATVISVDFMRDGKALDLSEYAVCVTNSAPNHDVLNIIGGNEAPLVVDGNRITWTLREFDTAQVGTYLAQLKVATGEQQLTVVFIRYNVERGVDGNIVTAPVQYTSFTALVKLVEDLRSEVDDVLGMTEELRELYDMFKQIVEDGGVTWDTLLGKPDTFPPSAHSHDEFAVLQGNIDALSESVGEQLDAIENGKADNAIVLTCRFLADGWTTEAPYKQTVLVDAMTTDLHGIAEFVHSDDLATERARLTSFRRITRYVQEKGALTAYCAYERPSADFDVEIVVFGKQSGVSE